MPRRKGSSPKVPIVDAGTRSMIHHDIVLFVEDKGYTVYIDPEILVVIQHIVAEHGRLAVKIKWGSPDLQLFVERNVDGDVQEFIKTLNTDKQDTAPESDIVQ